MSLAYSAVDTIVIYVQNNIVLLDTNTGRQYAAKSTLPFHWQCSTFRPSAVSGVFRTLLLLREAGMKATRISEGRVHYLDLLWSGIPHGNPYPFLRIIYAMGSMGNRKGSPVGYHGIPREVPCQLFPTGHFIGSPME